MGMDWLQPFSRKQQINKKYRAYSAAFSEELSSWQFVIFTMVIKWPSFHSSSFILFLSQLTTLSVTHLELLLCCSLRHSQEVIVLWDMIKEKTGLSFSCKVPVEGNKTDGLTLYCTTDSASVLKSNSTDLFKVLKPLLLSYLIFLVMNSAASSCHPAVAQKRFYNLL